MQVDIVHHTDAAAAVNARIECVCKHCYDYGELKLLA